MNMQFLLLDFEWLLINLLLESILPMIVLKAVKFESFFFSFNKGGLENLEVDRGERAKGVRQTPLTSSSLQFLKTEIGDS